MSEHDDTQVEETTGFLSEEPVTPLPGAIEPEENTSVAGSVLDRLRRKREAVMNDRSVDLEVPGYDGEIVLRCKYLDMRVLSAIGQRVMKTEKDQAKRNIIMAQDALINACDEILVRQDGELVGLMQAWRDEDRPVNFSSPEVAEFFGFDAKTARDCIMGVFGEKDALIASVNMKYQAWVLGSTEDIDMEAFAGEA